ncbi:MAG TPA: hypothetical protein PLO51_04505 [Candidatus Micrarchaeota archaeon]|nr:hypothetical protein [Candidatus Micrarchaeota archaeon]
MALTDNQKNMAVAAIAVVALGLGAYLFYPVLFPRPQFELGNPSNITEFFNKAKGADRAILVFDLTGTPAPSAYRDRLMQCGVGLAGSSGLANLNKTIFALDGNSCVTVSGNSTRDACIRDSQGKLLIILQAGSADMAQFYDNAMVISMTPQYNMSCAINALNATNSTTQ